MNGNAFGKVILCGEHAVVYGTPAIAAGIHLGATAQVVTNNTGAQSSFVLERMGRVTVGDGTDVARAFEALLKQFGETRSLHVEASTELPAAAGLGCSAALGVAISRAIAAFRGETLSPAQATEFAMAWERVFHGNPSGVDAAVAARGGCIQFVRGVGLEEIKLAAPLTLAIAHTGVASSTRVMVEGVSKLREKHPEQTNAIFDQIGVLSRRARHALEHGDLRALGEVMRENQGHLESLRVSSPEIDSLCKIARTHGALGEKLTGAGGGGCVVALVDGHADDILGAWRKQGVQCFVAHVHRTARTSDHSSAVVS